MQLTHDTLAAYCEHPNVGAVLVVALGCEQVVAQMLAEAAQAAGKPVGDPRDPVRGRHASRTIERARQSPRTLARGLAARRRASGATHRDADALAQVRRVRLHVRAWPRTLRSDASPIG